MLLHKYHNGGGRLLTSKKRLFLLGGLLFIIMNISGIYSLTSEIYDAESKLSTGGVDITLTEYDKNNEIFSDNGMMVSPGEEIVLIPRISNLGIDCYLRAKITYTIDNESFNISDYIKGEYSNWTKKDDYYYLDFILKKGQTIDLFNKVKIPTFTSNPEGKVIDIHILVEVVQSKNFDGNWDNVEIKESIDRNYDMDYTGSSSVIFEEDAGKYISLDNHFFDNLGNMLPGDIASEDINIINSSYDKIEYFLSIDYENLDNLQKKLLGNINLNIKNSKGEILVSSNLVDKRKLSLGTFSHNEKDKITIELSLPKNIDNEYSKILTKILWRFSYDVISHSKNPNNPNTGDFKFDWSITVFILSSIGFIIVLFFEKKNTDNRKKKKRKKQKKERGRK